MGALTQRERTKINNRFESYQKYLRNIIPILTEDSRDRRKEYYESIRIIAIASAALATFSVTILESFQSVYLACGIFLLLVVTMFSLSHILSELEINFKSEKKFKSDYIKPFHQRTKNCLDALSLKKSFCEWEKDEDIFNTEYEEMSRLLEKPTEDSFTAHRIMIIVFILAISLISIAILLPFINIIPLTFFEIF